VCKDHILGTRVPDGSIRLILLDLVFLPLKDSITKRVIRRLNGSSRFDDYGVHVYTSGLLWMRHTVLKHDCDDRCLVVDLHNIREHA
jgi:hypothetical protein